MLFLTLAMSTATLILWYFGERWSRRSSRGNFKPIFVFEYSDELQLARVRYARRLRQQDNGTPKGAPFESGLPSNPMLRITHTAEAFTITPVDDKRQVALCLIARMLMASGWRISNAYRVPNFAGMPLHFRIAGFGALRPGKHWLQQRFRDPIVVMRDDQSNRAAFDLMTAALAKNSEQFDFHGLMTLSHFIIRETIPPEQLTEYDRAWR